LGLAGTILLITTQTILSDHHQEWRTIAFAESNVVAGVCAILATVAVGGLANSMWGWRAAAGLAIVAMVLLFIYFRQIHFGAASTSTIKLRQDKSARLPRRFWIYWTVMLLGSSVEWCFVFLGGHLF
jgi:MFS family permease